MTDRDPEISRVSKGKRPHYFHDPATDKLFAIVMSLIGELSVTRDRLDALERVLELQNGGLRDELNDFVADDDATEERNKKRAAYVARVMRIVEMELDEAKSSREYESFEETLKSML